MYTGKVITISGSFRVTLPLSTNTMPFWREERFQSLYSCHPSFSKLLTAKSKSIRWVIAAKGLISFSLQLLTACKWTDITFRSPVCFLFIWCNVASGSDGDIFYFYFIFHWSDKPIQMNHCIFKGVLDTNLHEILHKKHCKINTLQRPLPLPHLLFTQNKMLKPHTTHTHTALYSTYNLSVTEV